MPKIEEFWSQNLKNLILNLKNFDPLAHGKTEIYVQVVTFQTIKTVPIFIFDYPYLCQILKVKKL